MLKVIKENKRKVFTTLNKNFCVFSGEIFTDGKILVTKDFISSGIREGKPFEIDIKGNLKTENIKNTKNIIPKNAEFTVQETKIIYKDRENGIEQRVFISGDMSIFVVNEKIFQQITEVLGECEIKKNASSFSPLQFFKGDVLVGLLMPLIINEKILEEMKWIIKEVTKD